MSIMVPITTLKMQIFTDGGARGNPGPAAIGVAVLVGGEIVYKLAKTIGQATNNEAEYQALLESLKWFLSSEYVGGVGAGSGKKIEEIEWFLDSKLVVEQVNKNWKIKQLHLRKLAEEVWEMLEKLGCDYKLSHVVREKNQLADSLVNQALDA